MSEEEEYTVFLEIMLNTFTQDELAYQDAIQREAINRDRKG